MMNLNMKELEQANGGRNNGLNELVKDYLDQNLTAEKGTYDYYRTKAYASKHYLKQNETEFYNANWDGENARNMLHVLRDWDSITF